MVAGIFRQTTYSSPMENVRLSFFFIKSPYKILSNDESYIINYHQLSIACQLLTPSLLLFFIGDPWRDATVSSDFHTRIRTSSQPIAVSDGFHCSDLSTAASVVDPTILTVQQEALSKIKEWLSAWTPPSAYREVKRDEPVSSQSGAGIVKPLNSMLRKGVQII